ncbi:MAG: PDZ domain-containing protein [Thermoplasmata archaeon]
MPIRYDVSVEDPKTHRLQVAVDIPEVTGPSVDLVLPSWIPGSYHIQDQARNLRGLRAVQAGSGTALPVLRQDKARWRISTEGVSHLEVRYEVYGHNLSDDGLDVTSEHLFLNAGMCLPYVEGRDREPLEVVVHVPSPWRVYTELAEIGRSPARFRAHDYDELVDEPIDCGTPVELTVRPAGIPHRILLCGRGGNFEAHQVETDVAKIVEAAIHLMGGSPLQHYTFFYHLADGRWPVQGGLEHKNSTAIIVGRTAFRPEEDYRSVLSVTSHEYFHLYNVKRIRPQVLGPFDYTKENYTHLLWAMEGSTDYFGTLILLRGSLLTPPKYLEEVAKNIQKYVNTPGRKVASLEELSYNTWIDLYHRYEETPNQSVSYYLKGDLATLCLDLEIRHRTEGKYSVESVFRALWDEYGAKDRGLEENEILAVANRITGLDLSDFFQRYISGVAEIDFDVFLGYAGLKLEPQERPPGKEDEPLAGWLGVTLKDDAGRARITTVLDDGPGRRAGLSPDDEVLALDGQRVTYADLPKALQRAPPGSSVEVTVFRRGLLTSVSVETGKVPAEKLLIVPVEDAPPLARRVHEGWLGLPWEPRKKTVGASATPTS